MQFWPFLAGGWGGQNLLGQFLFLKCNNLLCQKLLWNARRKYFLCPSSFIIVINNASCVHKLYSCLLLMFDGMAFKKSDTLPNSKMCIYLFSFESRGCGRTAVTWCERAWSGEGQGNSGHIHIIPTVAVTFHYNLCWLRKSSASEVNTKNKWIWTVHL